MSSEPPPNPITDTFNLRAWIQATLSIATANTLYLSKRIADTAAGLITFTAGIKTNTITALTNSANASIFSNSTNAVIDIGPTTGPLGESSLLRFGPGGKCNVQMGSDTSNFTAQKISSFGSSGAAVSLYTDNNNAIAMGTTSTAITIGTSQASTNTIGIGASGSIISIPGASTLGSIACTAINSTAAATTMNIASTSTGIVTLAVSANRTGVLNLGDGNSSTGAVHINNGSSSSGNTRIMNGTSQSGELTLGGVGNTVVIAVNRPLTLGYSSYPITTSSQMGYTTSPTITWTGTQFTTIATSASLPPGNYIWTFSISLTGTFVNNFIYFGSNVFNTELDSYRTPFIDTAGSYSICAGSYTFCNQTARTVSLTNYSTNSQTLSQGYWNIVRLS